MNESKSTVPPEVAQALARMCVEIPFGPNDTAVDAFGLVEDARCMAVIKKFIEACAAAPAAPAASTASAPTDLSKRLREWASRNTESGNIAIGTIYLTAAADEIDRYYGGMLAWKKSAEAMGANPVQQAPAPVFRCRWDANGMLAASDGKYVLYTDHAALAAQQAPASPSSDSPAAEKAGGLTLENAPIGTKAPANMGGNWTRTESGWKWCAGSTFPRPGGDWTGELIAPDSSTAGKEGILLPLDFSKPLETEGGKPVAYISSDVIEYKCARVCVDQSTGVVYSSPYVGLKIRNVGDGPTAVAAPAPVQQAAPSSWVSVDERLPEDETSVLIFRSNLVHIGAIFPGQQSYDANGKIKRHWSDSNNDDTLWSDISHWMPLPAAPGAAAPAQPVGLSEQDKLVAVLGIFVDALDGKRAANNSGEPGFEFNDALWANLEPARAAILAAKTGAA